MHTSLYMLLYTWETTGQPAGEDFLFLPRMFQKWNSGLNAWWEILLITELSSKSRHVDLIYTGYNIAQWTYLNQGLRFYLLNSF